MISKPFYKENRTDLLSKTSLRCQEPLILNDQSKKQILCRISFEIDGEQEQLPIYDNTNLDIITDQLLLKIRNSNSSHEPNDIQITQDQRMTLKEQIKIKILVIMESCIDLDKKAQKWKTKLKNIIQNKIKNPSKSSEAQNSQRNANQLKQQKSIKYFNYNPFKVQNKANNAFCDENLQNKKVQIIYRAKQLENVLNNKQKQKSSSKLNHRLYNLSKRNESERQEITKLREEFLQRQLLTQCTFHPKIDQYPFRSDKDSYQVEKQQDNPNSVFNRLYRQARQKKQFMKNVEKQLKLRQIEEVKQYTFIPRINSCSNQIMKIRKKVNQNQGITIYDNLYHQVYKKQTKQPERQGTFDFHPKICPNSQKIVQNKKRNNEKHPLFFKKQVKTYTQQRQNRQKSAKKFTELSLCSPKENLIKQRQRQRQRDINKLYEIVQKQMSNNKKVANRSARKSNESRHANNLKKFKRLETIHQDSTDNQLLSTKSTRNKDMITMRTECSNKSQKIKKSYQNINPLNNHYSQNKLPTMNIEPSYLISYGETNTQPSLRQINFNIKSPTNYQHQQFGKPKPKKARINPLQFFERQQSKKQTKSKNQQTSNIQQNTQISNSNLSKRQEDQVFAKIFKSLNTKQLQQIDSDSIFHNSKIPDDIKKVLFPMAEEMNQLNVGLDEQQFIWSISRICQSLAHNEKNQFIRWGNQLNYKLQ